MIKITYQELQQTFLDVLRRRGFSDERAAVCARLFADTTLDGVYSHGVNRFPRYIRTIDAGLVDVRAEPERVESFGVLERWDGRRGPGNLNARAAMNRAIEIAREHTIGCVALAHTNHWMRGGTYGYQAAEAGLAAICWTNTMPNLPPWGGREPRLGNNPLVIAVPGPEGPIVLDMALSQFSYGALESFRIRGEQLPVAGGFTVDGELTQDPGAIEQSNRPIPAGFWKGSGLSLLLDLLATLLSGGSATHQIPEDPEQESGVSQVFVAFDLTKMYASEASARIVEDILRFTREGAPASEDDRVYYPGERTKQRREQNSKEGIPVDEAIWDSIRRL